MRTLSRQVSAVSTRIKSLRDGYSNIPDNIMDLADRQLIHIPNHPLQILKKTIAQYFTTQPSTAAIRNISPKYKIFD